MSKLFLSARPYQEVDVAGEPDFFVSNDGNDALDGQSEATAWETIGKVNATNFSPGTIIGFRGGDVFNDAILSPATSGTSGNRITFTSYGTGQAIISGSGRAHAIEIANRDFLTFSNLQIEATQGGGLDNVIQIEDCDDLEILDNNFPGNFDAVPAAPNGRAGHIDFRGGAAGSRRFLIDGNTFTDSNNNDIGINEGEGNDLNGTISNNTFNRGQRSGEGDKIHLNNQCGNNVSITDNVFDNEDWGGGENCLDIKAGSGHFVARNQFVSSRQEFVIVHRGNGSGTLTTVDFEDNDFTGLIESGGRAVNVNDNAQATFLGDKFKANGISQELVRVGGATDIATGAQATFSAVGMLIPAGESLPRMVVVNDNAQASFFNTTLVSRIGNTFNELVNTDGTATVVGRNSIFDTDGTTPDVTNNTGDWTISNNLYNVGSGQNLGGTGSTTGDPDFNSEDPDNANFFLPNPGSPALDIGDATYQPARDLAGDAWGSPPNAGCRANDAG